MSELVKDLEWTELRARSILVCVCVCACVYMYVCVVYKSS